MALRSCVGYSALLVGMLNFAWSIYFVYRYMNFVYLVEDNDFDTQTCEIESAWVIVSYCSLFQIPLGSLVCLIYTLSCLIKACHGMFFACPGLTTAIKKKWWRIPSSLEHYNGEFDFEYSEDGTGTTAVLQISD